MENLNGELFQSSVRMERKRWNTIVNESPNDKQWEHAFIHFQKTAYPESPTFAPVVFQWNGQTVRKLTIGHSLHFWIGRWYRKDLIAAGVGDNGYFYTVEDVGEGSEEYELTVWKWGKRPRKLWTRHPVGPTIVLQGDYIYYCGVENRLRYPDVWCTDVATGTQTTRIFEELDKRFQVSILERGGVFVHVANALDQRLGEASPTGVSWFAAEAATLLPLGPRSWAANAECVVDGATISFPHGHSLEDGLRVGDDCLFVLVKEGQDSLWHWSEEGGWRLLHGFPKGVLSHIQLFHEPIPFPRVLIQTPAEPDSVWEYRAETLHKLFSYPEPLRLSYSHGGTAGSIQIPYIWVSHVQSPLGLIVEGYGAYGISARRSYPLRWLPYLAAGWAVAYVCPRGGREGGDAWYDGGRTAQRKHNTFEDTAVAIQHIQEELGIGAAKTVFFGRSAGGWLAARIAQDYGTDLVAAVYTEVPYVDVLRTVSTPSLPLTIMEYDEFGNGQKASNVAALRKLSPVDTVKPAKGPTPLLVIRTALHDSQVYPYEPLKWAKKLREAGWTRVYVGIDVAGGHFAGGDVVSRQRGEDAAILAAALDIPVPQIRKSLKPRKTVRNRSTKESRRSGKMGNPTRRKRYSSATHSTRQSTSRRAS